MIEAFKALAATPLPQILIFAGLVFLLFAIFPITINIKDIKVNGLSIIRQIIAGLIGAFLLIGGVFLFWTATQPSNSGPTQASQPIAILTIPATAYPTIAITPISSSTPTQVTSEDKVAITEVMATPCDGSKGPSVNEYIELYNYGITPSDVGSWWFATNNQGEGVHPNKLVAWETRNPGITLGNTVIANNTVIPPKGFAVILTPNYYEGTGEYHMPYFFPQGTILLTIESGNFLGNDKTGLLGSTDPLTVIVLYKSTTGTFIDNPISTYGSPKFGTSADSIQNVGSGTNNFPFYMDACYSMERISPSDADVSSNWQKVLNGNPGAGNYGQ